VPLPGPILKLCQRLARAPHSPSDFVFLNCRSNPYSKDCIVHKMDRLRTRAKIMIKAGEQVVLYTARHSFGTDGAGIGVFNSARERISRALLPMSSAFYGRREIQRRTYPMMSTSLRNAALSFAVVVACPCAAL
jgi:integrase